MDPMSTGNVVQERRASRWDIATAFFVIMILVVIIDIIEHEGKEGMGKDLNEMKREQNKMDLSFKLTIEFLIFNLF